MAGKNLNGLEKASILLKSLPAPVVENVLKHMDAGQAKLLRAALAKIGERGDLNELLARVLDEAAEVMSGAPAKPDPRGAILAGSTAAFEKEPKAAAPTPAARVDLRIAPETLEPASPRTLEIDPETDPLGAIARLPADLLAQALESEQSRTIALLMNYLDVEIAGQIYKRLSPAKRKEVSLRFTEQPATVNEELIRRIGEAVVRKCQAMRASVHAAAAEPGAREKRMAALLRGLERTERTEMLTLLEGTDAELAARVKGMLYQFDDVLRMQNASVQKLLTEIDTRSLAVALGGADPAIRDKFFNNLSKRAQDSLREEIELSGTVPSAKARQAQQPIVEAIQRLDQSGDLAFIE